MTELDQRLHFVVALCKDLTDYAWVTLEEAKNYDLIEGIWDEIRRVDEIIKSKVE